MRLTVGALLVVTLGLQIAAFRGVAMDDAFITFRYAQNLAEGAGPVFNSDQRVMGSTAPGQMLIAAAMYALFGQEALPSIMVALGCIAWTAQAVVVFRTLQPEFSRVTAGLAASLILAGATDPTPWLPMETNLVAALVLWSFYFAKRARWLAAAVTCALAGFTRPDAFLAACVLAPWCVREVGRSAWKPVAAFLALALPWPIFATMYFGSPLPQSAVTKFHRTDFFEYLSSSVKFIGSELLFSRQWPAVALALLLIAVGAVVLTKRSFRLFPLVLYGASHLASYLYLRPFTPHFWHLYPTVVVSVVSVAIALRWLAQSAQRPWMRRTAGLAAVALVLSYGHRTVERAVGYDGSYWGGNRHKVYRAVADFLRSRARPGDVLLAIEVGTVAYYSNIRVLDMGGLVSPLSGPNVKVAWAMFDSRSLNFAPEQPPVRVFQRGLFAAYLYHRDPPWECPPALNDTCKPGAAASPEVIGAKITSRGSDGHRERRLTARGGTPGVQQAHPAGE